LPEEARPRITNDVLVESDRLLIRRPEEGDGGGLERLFCDPAMMRHLGGTWTADKVADALQEWREGWGVDNCWYGVLMRKDALGAIGTAGFTENTIPGEAGLELSWFVVPEHQRQGFATEITDELLRFAFDGLGAERVVAETHPGNPASNRVLEKLRFVCLGERRHTYDYLPGFDRQVLWELTGASWRQGAPRTDSPDERLEQTVGCVGLDMGGTDCGTKGCRMVAMTGFNAEHKVVLDDLLLGDPRVRPGKMFGYPAYYAGRKLAICLYEQGVGVKLPERSAAALLETDSNVTPFQPMGRRRMREWVQIDVSRSEDLRRYATVFDESLRHVLAQQEK
jgi:ribosomal-protein-alanine N-acetyltransferase